MSTPQLKKVVFTSQASGTVALIPAPGANTRLKILKMQGGPLAPGTLDFYFGSSANPMVSLAWATAASPVEMSYADLDEIGPVNTGLSVAASANFSLTIWYQWVTA